MVIVNTLFFTITKFNRGKFFYLESLNLIQALFKHYLQLLLVAAAHLIADTLLHLSMDWLQL